MFPLLRLLLTCRIRTFRVFRLNHHSEADLDNHLASYLAEHEYEQLNTPYIRKALASMSTKKQLTRIMPTVVSQPPPITHKRPKLIARSTPRTGGPFGPAPSASSVLSSRSALSARSAPPAVTLPSLDDFDLLTLDGIVTPLEPEDEMVMSVCKSAQEYCDFPEFVSVARPLSHPDGKLNWEHNYLFALSSSIPRQGLTKHIDRHRACICYCPVDETIDGTDLLQYLCRSGLRDFQISALRAYMYQHSLDGKLQISRLIVSSLTCIQGEDRDDIRIPLAIAAGLAQACGFLDRITPFIWFSPDNFSDHQEFMCSECTRRIACHKDTAMDVQHLRTHAPDGNDSNVRLLRCLHPGCNVIMNALKEENLKHMLSCCWGSRTADH
jgi:hypothetical protein